MKRKVLIGSIIAISTVLLVVAGYLVYDNLVEEEPQDQSVEDSGIEDSDIGTGESELEATGAFNREYIADDVWGNVPAITLDADDKPHVAFYGREFGDLVYAYKSGGEWVYETVDSEGDVGTEKGIAVDSDGAVHMSYKDTTNGDTKYAVKTGDSWEISVLEDVPDTHHTVFVDLELDSGDRPHVVYHTESNEGEDVQEMSPVKYAVLENGGWEIEKIAPNGQFTQLALDSSGSPHVLYVVEPEEATIHAYKSGSEWVYDEIDPDSGNRRDVDISIDQEDDSVHIIYHDTDGGLLKYYFERAGGSGMIETVDEGLSTSGLGHKGIKLALDPDGNPHLAYFNGDREGFVHAYRENGEWSHAVVDEGGYPSIAVDSQGRVHIAHTWPLDGTREMAPEVVERDEDDMEQVVYQLLE